MLFLKSLLNKVLLPTTLFICHVSSGQHQLSYKPLRCVGEIPRDFLELSSEKVNNDQKKITERNLSRKDKKLERDFALNSNFSVDAILYSGKVLYGDVASVYINKVADKVLEHDKALRSELRFYVIKSGSVNAFSTSQGIIFVSIGLISQVENEAQLAYILCHEISHYVKKHSLEGYKRKNEIIRGKGKFKQLDFEDRIKEVYSYSKENEIEADREGLKMFLKTSYSPSAALSSFDVLLYSYLPYDEIDWRSRELQDSFYRFPASYTPSKGKEISADEEEDDEESTHPNISKRKAEIEKLLDNEKGGKDLFLHGLEYFNFIQQQARIELFFILLNQAQYEKAYYLSYLYKHNYHDTAYSAKIAAYCIYAKSTKQLSDEENSKLDISDNDIRAADEGASYYVSYFFDKVKKNELAVLSVRTCWDAHVKNPADSFYKLIFEESVKNLFKYCNLPLNKFIETLDTSSASDSSISSADTNTSIQMSKVAKLKIKQKKQSLAGIKDGEKAEGAEYYRFAFLEAYKSEYFRQTMQASYKAYKDHDEKEEGESDDSYLREARWHKKYGYAANIDSLILINPNFNRVLIGRKTRRSPLYDEKQEVALAAKYAEMARLNGISLESLNLLDKQNLTTEKLNEYAQIMEWISERLNNFSADVKLFNSQVVSDVIKAKGTSKVCLSGISYVVEGKELNVIGLVYSLFLFPVFPVYLAYQLHKTHYFNITTVIFDLETGKLVYLNSDELSMRYHKTDYLDSQIYSLFNQIKTKH
jgi:hypothetical protein